MEIVAKLFHNQKTSQRDKYDMIFHYFAIIHQFNSSKGFFQIFIKSFAMYGSLGSLSNVIDSMML